MKIRNDLAKSVVMDYVSEVFSSFDFSAANVMNMLAAKMFIQNNFEKILPIVSSDGFIDIDALEAISIPEIEKLGKFEMDALGKKYSFDVNDVKKLITKMKERAGDDH